ncbi:trimeric intracellular cation channel family protein [Vibrio parahaemolyticus]|uniref:TRIC cation channel family protein n=1 Tax=Vibrio parahaemolyticus TaxID=670 RepID=UPI001121A725|nr:TRIC cation channel family protein [Vibrio parahaemolyticus]EGR1578552.1 trimeric intracellular cation channel family protein [Vibrio parahaemolyticus]EHH1173952.1 trimeric intracellular cation channel family protein [Vibrio parahaemolyticus]MBE3838151.1 trimeric intracellular cation channel family protein [Vibrio parahaemolyticus]MBE4370971.1 trimeric intracellular cation channel family protein [Vibrio parahaemolyticus]MBM4848455.1 TRIC cation channel family protein [Vibrio parahaemolyticu
MDSMLLYMIDLFGTAIFAVSGVLLAGRLKMDPFGVIVLGSVTAIGGGTIRDMALGATPVFWITDTTYLWVIFITCLLTMILVRRPKRLAWWVLPVCDAIGLAVFVGIGVEKALAYNASGMVAVIMGVITGCGGGIIRDVLAREVPMVLRSEVYATACIIGGIFHTMAVSMGYDNSTALLAGVISTLVIRLGAIRWHLSLPTFAINR